MSSFKTLVVVLAILGLAAPAVQARRLLKEREWDGHNDGTEVLSRARVFEGGQGTPKRAVTPEAAESTANNQFLGVWRREMGNAPAVFATAEQDPLFVNPNRRKEVINTRARSAQQVVPGKEIDRINGNAQIPVVAMGGASVSQTFEGAFSVATSDSITVGGNNMPNREKSIKAKSMLTSDTPYVTKANKVISYGTTAQNAGSVALAGPADGKLAVAQANEVAAVAQASTSNADSWQRTNFATGQQKKWNDRH